MMIDRDRISTTRTDTARTHVRCLGWIPSFALHCLVCMHGIARGCTVQHNVLVCMYVCTVHTMQQVCLCFCMYLWYIYARTEVFESQLFWLLGRLQTQAACCVGLFRCFTIYMYRRFFFYFFIEQIMFFFLFRGYILHTVLAIIASHAYPSM